MSSDIPGLPPDPPPPPPPPPPKEVLPWEQRAELGFLSAFLSTVTLFVLKPAKAWSLTRERGDYAEPLVFAILVSWIGIASSSAWNALFGRAWMSVLPPAMREQLGSAMAPNAGKLLIQIGLAPILILIVLFISAAIYHVGFLLVGAGKESGTDFEGTFRVVAYSQVANLANVIPFVGGFVAVFWYFILMLMGAVRMHRATEGRVLQSEWIPGQYRLEGEAEVSRAGKALAGILIPLVFCCFCILLGLLAVIVGTVGLAAAFANR